MQYHLRKVEKSKNQPIKIDQLCDSTAVCARSSRNLTEVRLYGDGIVAQMRKWAYDMATPLAARGPNTDFLNAGAEPQ